MLPMQRDESPASFVNTKTSAVMARLRWVGMARPSGDCDGKKGVLPCRSLSNRLFNMHNLIPIFIPLHSATPGRDERVRTEE